MKTFLTLTTLGTLLAAGCGASDDIFRKEEVKEITVVPHTITCPDCTVPVSYTHLTLPTN